MAEEERKSELVCFRIEERWVKLLNRIKREYGLDMSTTVRMAVYFFVPRLLEALKHLEVRAMVELLEALDENLYKRLREELLRRAALGGGRA